MSRELKATLTIEAQTRGIDKIGEARQAIESLGKGATESNPELVRMRTTLGELAQQQRLITQFVQLKAALTTTAAEMQKAQAATNAAARELKAKQQATQAATQAEQAGAASLTAARDHHAQLKDAIALARAELKELRTEARNAGGANAELSTRVKETQGQLAILRQESQRAGAQVKTLAGEQRNLGAALKTATADQTTAERVMARAVGTAQSVKSVYEAQRTTLHRLRQSLTDAGISSTALGAAQQRLTAGIAAARAAIAAQSQQMAQAVVTKRSMRDGIESISTSLARMQRLYMAWIGGNQVVQYVRQLIGVADTYKNIAAQVALVSRTNDGYNVTLAETAALARRTYSNIESTTQLMASIARAGGELGVSQQTVLRLTETINKANQVSGQSAASADAAVVQLIQGLQSGVLRGEEFNSMMEQAPRLARALADGLGVPVSALRAMANEGRLTTDVIIDALQSQAAAVDAEFAALPATVGRSLTNLRTAWMQFIGALDDGTGATAGVAAALDALAGVLDMLAGSTQELGAVVRMVLGFMAAQGVANLAAWAAGALTAGKTVGVLALAFTRLATAARLAWAAMASSPAFIIVGLVELVRTIDYLISNYDELAQKVRVYVNELFKQMEIEDHTAETQRLIAQRYAEISQATGVAVSSMEELNAAVAAGKIHFDEASGKWTTGAGSLQQVEQASGKAARQLREIAKALQAAAGTFEPVAEAAREALADVQQRLGEARTAISAAAGDIATTYGTMTTAVAAAMDEQLAAIERRFEAERTALEASGASQREIIAVTSRLLIEQLAAETAARQAATAEVLRLAAEEGEVRKQAAGAVTEQSEAYERAAAAFAEGEARRQEALAATVKKIDEEALALLTSANAAARRGEVGQEALVATIAAIDEESRARKQAAADEAELARQAAVKEVEIADARRVAAQRVENEIMLARKGALEDLLEHYRQHVDDLNAEANRHLAEVRRLEDEKRDLARSTEDRIREIRRGGMSEEEALADRKKQLAELQSKAREALERGDYETAKKYANEAMTLAGSVASEQQRLAKQTAEKEGEYSTATRKAKGEVEAAIKAILTSQELANKAIDAEATAHGKAAQKATEARNGMKGQIEAIQTEVTNLATKLAEGLKLTVDADTAKLQAAVTTAAQLLAKEKVLIPIVADLTTAEKQIKEYDALLKAGKELPVNANFRDAEEALKRFHAYAQGEGAVALAIKTEAAQSAISDVSGKLQALSSIRTESQHRISDNAAAARAEIDSLNGRNTSSTHTIYVRRVETNATGGLAGRSLRRYAAGGDVAPSSPLMTAGAVPGVGDTDSVARTLPVGAYVIRKAAVRHYGRDGLADIVARAKAAAGSATQAVASVTQRASERVSALLMPGEHVFAPADVARLGVRFFDGLNAMTIAPEPQRFAAGGPVTHKAMDLGGRLALLNRAEQLGGLTLRKRAEAVLKRAQDRAKNLPTRSMDIYYAALREIEEMLDRFQLAQERKERKERESQQAQQQTQSNSAGESSSSSRSRDRSSGSSGDRASGRSAGAGSPVDPSRAAAAREYVVTINLGGSSTRVGMRSERDAQSLVALLRQLETAQQVAQ